MVAEAKYSADKAIFQISYILRSTALSMIILPIWWVDKEHISVQVYLTVLALVPLLSISLDFPFSVFADKIGLIKSYFLGLVLFSFSFLAPVLFKGLVSYLIFTVFSILADSILAGVEYAIIKIIGGKDFYMYYSSLSKMFYLVTIPMFFASILLYQFNNYLPFIFQSLFILLAAINILRLRNLETSSTKEVEQKISGWEIKPTSTYYTVVVIIIILFAVFDGIIQFQNRGVQLLLSNSIYVVALLFSIGNIISSLGLSRRFGKMIQKRPFVQRILFISVLFFISLLFLASQIVPVIIVGYVGISFSKGLYRPIMNEFFSNLQPKQRWKASWFSVYSVLGGILLVMLNYLFSAISDDIAFIEKLWAVLLLAVVLISLPVILKVKRIIVPFLDQSSLSDKQSKLVMNVAYPSLNLIQFYNFQDKETIDDIVQIQENSSLSTPKIVSSTDNSITYDFFEGIKLEKLDKAEQEKVLPSLFSFLSGKKNLSFAVENEPCGCLVELHGDFHPGNILVDGNEYVCIDWDFSGIGSRFEDEFSLIWHPRLKLTIQEKFEATHNVLKFHSPECQTRKENLKVLIQSMLQKKIRSIKEWESQESYTVQLLVNYEKVLNEVEAYDLSASNFNLL